VFLWKFSSNIRASGGAGEPHLRQSRKFSSHLGFFRFVFSSLLPDFSFPFFFGRASRIMKKSVNSETSAEKMTQLFFPQTRYAAEILACPIISSELVRTSRSRPTTYTSIATRLRAHTRRRANT
jgi:hypothetical protein